MGLRNLARRVVFGICIVVGTILILHGTAAAVPAAAPAVGGNDYPWQQASMDGMSPLRFAYRNCTDYVAYQLNKQLAGAGFSWNDINSAGNGNASAWAQGAAGKFMVDSTPRQGAVAWWGVSRAGGYGHVALVTSVSGDGQRITVDEYNTDMAGHFSGGHVLTKDQSGWPEGFIHVADVYADGTYLTSDSGQVYVVIGGAPLPAAQWKVDGPHVMIPVLQHQVDIMPSRPRDGSRVRAVGDGMIYEAHDGVLQPLISKTPSDITWASRYLSPEASSGEVPAWQAVGLVAPSGTIR